MHATKNGDAVVLPMGTRCSLVHVQIHGRLDREQKLRGNLLLWTLDMIVGKSRMTLSEFFKRKEEIKFFSLQFRAILGS